MTVANPGPGFITVGLNPYPIPLGTIQVKVFQDAAPARRTFDRDDRTRPRRFNARSRHPRRNVD